MNQATMLVKKGSDDDVEAGSPVALRRDPLLHDRRLQIELHPGRNRGADYAHDHINVTLGVPDRAPRQLHRGQHGIVPAGLRQDPGYDIGNVEDGGGQKDLFDPFVISLDHQQPDGQSADGYRYVLADMEELHAAGNAGKLRHDVAEVDHHQQQHQQERHAQPELFTDEITQAFAGYRAHACTHFLHHQQSHGDGDHGPQQRIAELGSGIGISEDAAGIVIDIGGDEARPQHGEEEQYPDSPALEHQ